MTNLRVHDLTYSFVPKERRRLCRRVAALKEHNRLCRDARQSMATYVQGLVRARTHWVSAVMETK